MGPEKPLREIQMYGKRWRHHRKFHYCAVILGRGLHYKQFLVFCLRDEWSPKSYMFWHTRARHI